MQGVHGQHQPKGEVERPLCSPISRGDTGRLEHRLVSRRACEAEKRESEVRFPARPPRRELEVPPPPLTPFHVRRLFLHFALVKRGASRPLLLHHHHHTP